MTMHVDDASRVGRLHWRGLLRRLRVNTALKTFLVKPVLSAAATFVAGAIVVGVLREPIDHRLVPSILEYLHQEQVLYLYKLKPNGGYSDPDETYAVFMPKSGTSRSGRMIERLGTELNPQYDYAVSGSEHAGILTLSFRPFAKERIGGGTFVGDGNRPGYFVGLLTGLGHEDGQPCKLVHYLAILGHPGNAHKFASVLNEAVKTNPTIIPTAALQATEFAGVQACGSDKAAGKTADNHGWMAALATVL